MPSSKTSSRVLIIESDSEDSYSSSSSSDGAVVVTKKQLMKLLKGGGSVRRKQKPTAPFINDDLGEKDKVEDKENDENDVEEEEEGPIRKQRPYSRGNLNNFPFKDDEPLTSLVAPKSTLPTPFWHLPPRFQIHLAKKTFKDYSLNNPASRGRQGKLLMDVKDLLPSMEELFGEGWMRHCPGGLRWWVVGVGNGDVEGFLDGRKFEGGMREGEFVEIVAVTSEGILTKESKRDAAGGEEVFLEGAGDSGDEPEDDDYDDLLVVKSGHHKHHRKKHRHKKSHQHHHHHHHKRHHHQKQKRNLPTDDEDEALESFVTKELVRRSQSPLRHYIRETQESASIAEKEDQLYVPRPPRAASNKAKEKPVAWSIPVEGEADDVREGGNSQDKAAEEEAENFINDVLEEDKPAAGEGGEVAVGNVPMSRVPGQPTTAQLKALRHTLESADATSHHNSSITGTCHPRVFIRTCQAILQWTPGEEEVRMLSSKGGEVCYRVFLRDPIGWGYNVGSAGAGGGVGGVGSTAKMIADKARGGVKIVAKDDGHGIVRNLRMKLVKIAGEGQFGVKGLPALKRAFEIFDEAGSESVDTETFFRVVTRLGVRVGSKGRKKLTHILGVEGGKKMSYAKLLDFSTSSEEAEAELEFKIVAAVISAMRRSKCTYEALRGAVLAWDESGCGSVTLEDFAKALQQSGVGNELSKGLIEAIGRRYAGERSMVVYGTFLAKIKETVDELEEKERRLKVADSMRRRDDEREDEIGGVTSMREMADHAARRLKERGGGVRDQNFGDPFFSKGKTSKGRKTRPPSKPAWRANKGHAPSTIPKPEVKTRALPKYLRNVESRIKGDLEAVRDRRVRAKASRLEAAKEVVAKRRLDKHMQDGLDDGDDVGAKLGEELLAREIADMYVGVVDDVLEGQGDRVMGEVFGDVDSDEGDGDEDDGSGAGTYVAKAAGGELSGWVGDFDFSKGGKGAKKKVKSGEEFKGDGGEDLTGKIAEVKQSVDGGVDVDVDVDGDGGGD
ncbi:hypothetical protein TrVE_jg1286 [Triparma verrucosa]|uniref:Uncharacterized protein n=1 Tax=Triparma verrucosa TaxID=1606542 RepID=A0A9W7BX22_9STRA|nr:hypothetical protein TrVE_jg1286 [Triparma verrucosa]